MDISNRLKNIDIVRLIVRELQDKSTLVLICQNESMCDDLVHLLSNYSYEFTVGRTKDKKLGIRISFDKKLQDILQISQIQDDYNRLSELTKGNVRYVTIGFLNQNDKLLLYHQKYPLVLPQNN